MKFWDACLNLLAFVAVLRSTYYELVLMFLLGLMRRILILA